MIKVKLSDLAHIKMGQSPQGETCNEYGDGIPLLNGPSEFTSFYPIPKQYTNDPKKICQESDILFCVRGSTTGRMNWADKKYAIGRGLASISHKKGEEFNHFLKYLIEYNLDSILNLTSGSTFPNLTNDNLASYEFYVPEIEVQKKISSFLSNLDSKIELNNRINTELEAMAKTLYDYWFVQFDFADANGKPYKTSGGKMVWNAELKREIPEGWEDGKLNDIANITMGQSPPGESYNEEGKGMIFYQGCTDFGNRYPTIRKFTTSPSRLAKQGDILLSVRAPVGTLNISKEDCCIGRGLACMNSKNDAVTYLFGVMVNLKQTFDRRNVSGTTFGSITKDDLFSLPVIIPNEKTVREFHNLVFPTFEKQNKIEVENQELASLRDWLLPMLMNGQVNVVDVAEELGMVAEESVRYGK
jgi:type I restriction enzyme S subunit